MASPFHDPRTPSKRKPHNRQAGYIAEKIYKPSGTHVVIYVAIEQNISDTDGKYVVVCDEHGSIVNTSSIPKAREFMKVPAFCEDCMASTR